MYLYYNYLCNIKGADYNILPLTLEFTERKVYLT